MNWITVVRQPLKDYVLHSVYCGLVTVSMICCMKNLTLISSQQVNCKMITMRRNVFWFSTINKHNTHTHTKQPVLNLYFLKFQQFFLFVFCNFKDIFHETWFCNKNIRNFIVKHFSIDRQKSNEKCYINF